MDDIVPFTVKAQRSNVDSSHLLFGDLSSYRVSAPVQAAGDGQAFGGRSVTYSLAPRGNGNE